MEELAVLEEQLEELLEEGAVDPEDALEIALVAGLCARMGAASELMAEAVAWRDGPGADLLREAWSELDHEGIVADFDEQTDGTTEEEDVEEAVLDIDELVAAAIWCGKGRVVAKLARHVAEAVDVMPEIFSHLKADAEGLVRMESVGLEYGLYAFWFKIHEIEEEAEA